MSRYDVDIDSLGEVCTYKQGRADAFHEVMTEMSKSPFPSERVLMVNKYIQEQLKEQKDE